MDFQRWQNEISSAPLKDCLRLCDYLPAETQAFLTSSGLPGEVLDYTWLEEATYEKVARWGKAAVHAGRVKQPTGAESFFITPIRDAYDYDRALRAGKALDKRPIRRSDIEERIVRVLLSQESIPYVLEERPFEWTANTPEEAVDATALVLEAEPPDRLWLVEYVQERASREQIRAGVAAGLANMVADLQAEQSQQRSHQGPPNRGKRKRRATWDPIIYAQYGDWHVEVARWE